jgi:hypothetical protein
LISNILKVKAGMGSGCRGEGVGEKTGTTGKSDGGGGGGGDAHGLTFYNKSSCSSH